MKIKTTIIISLVSTLLSCSNKKNSGSASLRDQQQIKEDLAKETTQEESPIETYELKDQTESFYVSQETRQLKIVITPLLKKIETRSHFIHFVPLMVSGGWSHGMRGPSSKTGVCKIEEARITDFKIEQANEKMSYKELSLTIDDSPITFSPDANFKFEKNSSIFTVELPEAKRDYFISVASMHFSNPIVGLFNTEECDRKVAENSGSYYDNHQPVNLAEVRSDQKIWTSYKVEIFKQ